MRALNARPALTSIITIISLMMVISVTSVQAASKAAAKVQFVVGNVFATSTDGKKRKLRKGDRLFEGDTVRSGDNGSAQIIYRDRSRMAVRVNTTFKIETYDFDSKNVSKSSSIFSLLSGALRAVTGLIGNANKEAVTITTPLATIGIRGTDHEVVHIAPQAGKAIARLGTYNKVYIGGTRMKSKAGAIDIGLRQTGFIEGTPGNIKRPVKIPDLPKAIKTQIIDKIPVQAKKQPVPGTNQETSSTVTSGTVEQPRQPTTTGTDASTEGTAVTKSVDGNISTTTTRTLDSSTLSTTTTIKTLAPSLTTNTTLKSLDSTLNTDSTASRLSTDTTTLDATKTLNTSITTDTTLLDATRTLDSTLTTDRIKLDSTLAIEPVLTDSIKTLDPVLAEPVLSEPSLTDSIRTIEPVLTDSIKTIEPVLSEPIKTIEPVLTTQPVMTSEPIKTIEPVLSTQPVLSEPIKSIGSTTTRSLTLEPSTTTILRK